MTKTARVHAAIRLMATDMAIEKHRPALPERAMGALDFLLSASLAQVCCQSALMSVVSRALATGKTCSNP